MSDAVSNPVVIVSRSTFALLNPLGLEEAIVKGVNGADYRGVLVGGVPVLASYFCPTWGPEPTRWRRFMRTRDTGRGLVGRFARWTLREEKRMRVVYRMEMP